MDSNLKRAIIIDHYKYPHNQVESEPQDYLSKRIASDSCIDDYTAFIKKDGDKIIDIKYLGNGCSISKAAISILSDLLVNKEYDDFKAIVNNYLLMLEMKEYDKDLLGEANALDTVALQANRKNCALIGLKAILNVYGKE